MGKQSVIVDASFLVALWRKKDGNHEWAIREARLHPPPWIICESALSEADHLLSPEGCASLRTACRRGAIAVVGIEDKGFVPVLDLLEKYSDVPMSIADACLVRLTETLANALLLTTDSDFKVYRRHGRKVIPLRIP
ncbi:type II toxin-antitoxin system VapC family toxin [Luteolibacter sp. Populi]|uniref:type II toxin-antitoxin system VapC family toxin n=1 Tax=Luteolibacter sp. Populi TaxID=3230487 RepID=UPI0034671BA5